MLKKSKDGITSEDDLILANALKLVDEINYLLEGGNKREWLGCRFELSSRARSQFDRYERDTHEELGVTLMKEKLHKEKEFKGKRLFTLEIYLADCYFTFQQELEKNNTVLNLLCFCDTDHFLTIKNGQTVAYFKNDMSVKKLFQFINRMKKYIEKRGWSN